MLAVCVNFQSNSNYYYYRYTMQNITGIIIKRWTSLFSDPQASVREVFKEDAFGENVILDTGIYLGSLKVCSKLPTPVPSLPSGQASLIASGLYQLSTKIRLQTLQGPG